MISVVWLSWLGLRVRSDRERRGWGSRATAVDPLEGSVMGGKGQDTVPGDFSVQAVVR